jgi:hypothetical protein
MIQNYQNNTGKSSIESFIIGSTFVTILFRKRHNRKVYGYEKYGAENVEKIKILAMSGTGLNRFISSLSPLH